VNLMASGNDKTARDAAAPAVTAVLPVADQSRPSWLRRFMVPVPGFTPPQAQESKLCQIPAECTPEQRDEYRSAGVLLQALAAEARAWSERLPPAYRPAIVALLHGGLQIEVRTLAQVSFDGIRIEGMMHDSPCSLLAHQSTVQLVCHAVLVQDEIPKRPIGFIWPDRAEEI
jgi:hypothetical protein